MATGIVLPPFSALHADLLTSRVPSTMEGLEESSCPSGRGTTTTATEAESENPLMCGFEHRLVRVKTEPMLEECMESFCNKTYTELTSATLSQIKQGQTDLYCGSTTSDGQSQPFSSWTYTHPEHWGAPELLDWLFSLAEAENFDGALFRGEAYNTLTGRELCNMTLEEFVSLDSHYGFRVYEVFQMLLRDADFKKPVVKCETGGNVPDFACLDCPSDLSPARTPTPTPTPSPININIIINANLPLPFALWSLSCSTSNGNHKFLKSGFKR